MSHWNIKFAWLIPWFPLFFLVLVGAGTVGASTLAFGASTPLGLPESSEPLSFLRCCFLSRALTLVSHVPGGHIQNQMGEWPDVCKRMIQTIFHLWLQMKISFKKWWISSPESPKLAGTLCEAKQNWKMYCVISPPMGRVSPSSGSFPSLVNTRWTGFTSVLVFFLVFFTCTGAGASFACVYKNKWGLNKQVALMNIILLFCKHATLPSDDSGGGSSISPTARTKAEMKNV